MLEGRVLRQPARSPFVGLGVLLRAVARGARVLIQEWAAAWAFESRHDDGSRALSGGGDRAVQEGRIGA